MYPAPVGESSAGGTSPHAVGHCCTASSPLDRRLQPLSRPTTAGRGPMYSTLTICRRLARAHPCPMRFYRINHAGRREKRCSWRRGRRRTLRNGAPPAAWCATIVDTQKPTFNARWIRFEWLCNGLCRGLTSRGGLRAAGLAGWRLAQTLPSVCLSGCLPVCLVG